MGRRTATWQTPAFDECRATSNGSRSVAPPPAVRDPPLRLPRAPARARKPYDASAGSDVIKVDGLFDPVMLAEGAAATSSSSPPPTSPLAGFAASVAARAVTQQDVYDGAEGLAQFKKGFLKFKKEVILAHVDHFRDLASSQAPKVMVIACCDSRVDPALLMGAGPGDIFIVRNIANLVPPFERQGSYHGTSAALEYAVLALKVEHIVVMGHQNCGGIKALMQRRDAVLKNDFIDKWMEIAATACEVRARARARARTTLRCHRLRSRVSR